MFHLVIDKLSRQGDIARDSGNLEGAISLYGSGLFLSMHAGELINECKRREGYFDYMKK